jgi:ATP phosphoribosyltransferase regulatory subunit
VRARAVTRYAVVAGALAALETLAPRAIASARCTSISRISGYHYQSGASFSVFTAGEPNAIGRGERYDGIGKAFGRARPATGFTLDLRQLASLVERTT